MKDVLMILLTTIATFAIWLGVEIYKGKQESMTPEKLLEISIPIRGKIDVDYIKGLNPANE